MKMKTSFISSSLKKKIGIAILVTALVIAIVWSILTLFGNKVSLTCAEAEELVLKKLGSGTIVRCELEHKKYEVEVIYKDLNYEFEVDGNSGEIKGYEVDFE